MRDLLGGFRYLLAGQRWVAGHGRWLGFGLLPGLVSLVLYAAALIGLFQGADSLTAWATPFADDWSDPWLGLFRGLLTALVIALGLFLSVITFTAVTLLIGQPFYESLSEQVDLAEGGHAPESGLPLWRELWISARDSVRVLLRVALYSVLLFACGFIPVVGQTVVPALGFCVSGYFLTHELASVALQRRKIGLSERLGMLRERRLLVLGFGVPLVLAFLVPLVAVFLMPGAVAGATLMARELTGESGADPRTPEETPGTGTAPAGPYDRGPAARGPYGTQAGPYGPTPGNPYADPTA
ncbi:EI24 domain-containing protein [Streptomyces sp. NPDC097619]|uniref:EI24 domain-containing protein n=1 Tax=Streptomyces sp. NPDC097619 TaxID=3157228 RepID=UPI0033233576